MLCYKVLNDCGPAYLKDMLHISEPKRSGLRSVKHFLPTYGDRSFSYGAIELWNSLSLKL